MMITFYYTSTGNSLYVAKRIGGQLLSIPQFLNDKKNIFEDDAIGFVFPCYGFGVPKIVKQFIVQSNFRADYFFAVMTYGNIAADGLQYLIKIVKKSNITFNYSAEILMIDNYLPVYKIEDQIEKEQSKNIEPNIKIIVDNILQRKNKEIKKGLGSKAASAIIQAVEPIRKGDVDNKFSVNDNCIKCGICQKVCPKGNIVLEEKPVYLHSCDFCMGCINLCPQNAIHLKGQKSTARFMNPNVKLQEIITANNQTLSKSDNCSK